MSQIRVMFVGSGPSGLPTDRTVNTFNFQGGDTPAADLPLCMDAVESFYLASRPGSPIGNYLSPWVQRNAELRGYDMTQPKPRVPTIRPITLGATGGTGMPEEVAICVSWLCDPPITRRRRGRTFIGPLNNNAVSLGSSSLPARPNSGFTADLLQAAGELIAFMGIESLFGLQVLSVAGGGTYARVRQAYVDNALDTQRRRGPETTGREFAIIAP